MTHRHRQTDVGIRLALLIAVALAVAVALSLVLAPAQAARPESSYAKAKRIVFAVFPDETQDAALRVVGCETGYTYSVWSYNPSGASGWFQVLQGNAGRLLRYDRAWPGGKQHGGHLLVIPSGRKLFLPWTNAKVALFLSHGGSDWHEWVCQPG